MAKKYDGRFPTQQPAATAPVVEEQPTTPATDEQVQQDTVTEGAAEQPAGDTTEQLEENTSTPSGEHQDAVADDAASEETNNVPPDPDSVPEEPVVQEQPAPVVTPVAAPAPAPVVQAAVQSTTPVNQETLTVDEQTLIDFFKDYAVKMAKGRPVSPSDIATNQVAWFRKVMIVLEMEPKSFRRVMDFLMAHILEEIDGAYHPARRMRGMTAQLRLSDRERIQFQVLMQLFCDMADPAGRDAMRSQTSAEKALGNGLSETARARLGDYFRLG